MLTQTELKEFLHYDPLTGLFTWIKNYSSSVIVGKVAGTSNHGYTQLDFLKKRYMAHRLAWFYMTGQFPTVDIDHINRIKSDNRWENLRLCTGTQNEYNKVPRKNITGYRGVRFNDKSNKFHAGISMGGVYQYLGTFSTAIEASIAYEAKAKTVHGEFYVSPTIDKG